MSGRDFSERDIHLALDGEMPADERAAFEAWLEAHPDMKAKNFRFASDRAALQAAFAGVPDEPVPARLSGAVLGEPARRGASSRSRWWLAAAAVLLLGVGGLGGYAAGVSGMGRQEDTAADQFAEEAIAAHVVYAAEQRHAVDVPASDKAHMQDWLSRRVGVKLVAPDLAAEGFELVGGRLLPAGTNKAAMLLYDDGSGNRVSIFVMAEAGGAARGTYAEASNGPRAVYWTEGGYGCAVVGSVAENRLDEVADSAYRQLLSARQS
jgi:anti-sigma factor RsiW